MELQQSTTHQKGYNVKNTPKINTNNTSIKRKNKRKKKKNSQKYKNSRGIKKVEVSKQYLKGSLLEGNNKFICTMTSWAENYSKIVSWQSRHQIAYWKAKATALEHENKILHEIIRKNKLAGGSSSESSSDCDDSVDNDDAEANTSEEVEVSQEYIDFLVANSKYREDAKREREKYKKCHSSKEEVIQKMEELPVASEETELSKIEEAKALYGENYKHLVAREMALDANFLADKDKFNPVYWPNTPFNS